MSLHMLLSPNLKPMPYYSHLSPCGLQHVGIMGETTLGRSLQIAQLALKHRQNKLHRQRIVMFVASPIPDDKASLCFRSRL